MNTPVNFKIAKLLKEKGFDNITDLIYVTNHIPEVLFENINSLKHSDGNNPFCSAPIIAEVVMWLYEKHGIWIYSFDEDCIKKTFGYHISLLTEEDKELYTFEHVAKAIVSSVNGMTFNSPTEAYEAAIDYTLTKLI